MNSQVYHCFSCCRRPFYEKRISAECTADCLGDEWKVICLQLV